MGNYTLEKYQKGVPIPEAQKDDSLLFKSAGNYIPFDVVLSCFQPLLKNDVNFFFSLDACYTELGYLTGMKGTAWDPMENKRVIIFVGAAWDNKGLCWQSGCLSRTFGIEFYSKSGVKNFLEIAKNAAAVVKRHGWGNLDPDKVAQVFEKSKPKLIVYYHPEHEGFIVGNLDVIIDLPLESDIGEEATLEKDRKKWKLWEANTDQPEEVLKTRWAKGVEMMTPHLDKALTLI